jgi:hypothetical protein
VLGVKSEAIALAKLTLITEGLETNSVSILGYGDSPEVYAELGVPIEVHAKRALCYLGCSDFEVGFESGELDSLDDRELQIGVRKLGLDNADGLRKEVAASKKKNIVSTVVEKVISTPKATKTEESDESSDEADSADDSE